MVKNGSFRKLLSLLLVLVMLLPMAAPTAAAESGIRVEKVDNSAVSAGLSQPEQFPEAQPHYSDTDIVRVSIVLEGKSTVEAGFCTAGIAGNAAAMVYRDALREVQDTMILKIQQTTAQELDVVWQLTLAANLISANVRYGQIAAIEAIPGVARVVPETQYYPETTADGETAKPNTATSGSQTGSYAAWAAGYTGAGSKIAIIDTGLDVLHEAFNADAFAHSLAGSNPDLLDAGDIAGVLSKLNVLEKMRVSAEDLYVNDKVPFGFNYVDGNLDLSHLESEHGSHVAGIAAANAFVERNGEYVSALTETCVQGMAPDAQILVMKVFGENGGAYDSDYMAAVEDAILLGADSVNLSLGSRYAGASRNTVYQDLLDSLSGSGVVVVASTGNNGAWTDHAEHYRVSNLYAHDVRFHTAAAPSTYTNILGVASSENDYTMGYTITAGEATFTYIEYENDYCQPLTTLAGEQKYVYLEGSLIDIPDYRNVVKDKIVVQRLDVATDLASLANMAVNCGAKAYIGYFHEPGFVEKRLNNVHYQSSNPVACITYGAGMALKQNAVAAGSGKYYEGTLFIGDTYGKAVYYNRDLVSAFSGWGVPESLELKPEIIAPGGNIYSVAGYIAGGANDHGSYAKASGTSLAAPQVAGMAAVLAQYFRESGLPEKTGLDARVLAQSLLMSTAVPMWDHTKGSYFPVMQQGAGQANIANAIAADSYILMDRNATDSWADGKIKAELGDDPERTGQYVFSFTLNNLSDKAEIYQLDADVFRQGSYGTSIASDIRRYAEHTVAADAAVVWKVNGKTLIDGGVGKELDFNGDEVVDEADAQAILEYTVGNRTFLVNEDKADINGDGQITSFDAHLLLHRIQINVVTVEANGSVTVEVTITLSDAEKEKLEAEFSNGTYIQAFVFARSLATGGACHSIPVLAFYGNWSDASMFNRFSYKSEDNNAGSTSYFYGSTYNTLFVQYGNEPNNKHYFGGNPVADGPYMPERNAISAKNGSRIHSASVVPIRNAADTVLFVKNLTDGSYLQRTSFGSTNGAYYYPKENRWEDVYTTLEYQDCFGDLPEGTALEVGVMLVPEYYLDENGNYDETRLGDGVVFSMPMVVDNTAPVLDENSVRRSANGKELYLTASDNRYVAGVILYSADGTKALARCGSRRDAGLGETLEYTMDVSQVGKADEFLLQVIDYARNTTTYRIEIDLGVSDIVTGLTVIPSELILNQGKSAAVTVRFEPTNVSNTGVIWSSSDESVATVDENGIITGVGPGEAVITAAAVLNPNITGKTKVTVKAFNASAQGILTDAEGNTMFFDWDMTTKEWTGGTALSVMPTSATRDTKNNKYYVMDGATLQMHRINARTGAIEETADNPLGVPLWDMAYSELFSSASQPLIHGVYGYYFLPFQDPMALNGYAFDLKEIVSSSVGGIVAVTSAGYEKVEYEGVTYYTEHVLLLDDQGDIWNFWMYEEDDTYKALISKLDSDLLYRHGVKFGDANGHKLTSMVISSNGDLYVSAFTGSENQVFRLIYNERQGNPNNYIALKVDSFGQDVWPAVLTSVTTNGSRSNALAGPAPTMQTEAKKMPAQLLRAEAGPLEKAEPASADQEEVDRSVSMTVTAKDGTGTQVASTNGMITLRYDPQALELTRITVAGDYQAVNDSTAGTVTFAYVGPEAIAAGTPVAQLVFDNKTDAAVPVTVNHKEYADQIIDYTETLTVAAPVPLVEWVSASTTLGGNIGLNFYVKLADLTVNDESTFVRFSFAGRTLDVPLADALVSVKDGVTRYRFTCPLNAKNMTDEVTAQVMSAAGAVGEPLKMSVAKHCNYMIQNSKDAELVTLMKTMLNYGAAAQMLFDYNTDDLANAELSEEDKVLADVDASEYASKIIGSSDYVKIDSATLILETETSIRIYFTIAENIVGYVGYSVDGIEVEPGQKDGKYYIEIKDIAAQDLDRTYRIKIGNIQLLYSGLSYVNTVLNNPDIAGEALVNTVKALYAYNKAAENYFN